MKDSYFFKHDSNARHDPKIQILISEYGLEGYGRYWVIIEMLREATCYKLETKDYVWSALALELKATVSAVKKFVSDCIDKYELLTRDEGFFYSEALLARMVKLEEIRSKRQRAAEIRWIDKELNSPL